MSLKYKVVPTFRAIHQDTSPYIFVMGPVGSGKSSGCIMHAYLNALKQQPDSNGVRKTRHLVVRATTPELKYSTIKSWIAWFGDKIVIKYTSPIEGKIEHMLPDGTKLEMEVLFIAVNDDRAVEKLRSLEVTSAHINEASEIPFGVLELISTRINRYPKREEAEVVITDGKVDVSEADDDTRRDVAPSCVPFVILDYNAVSTDHWIYKVTEEQKLPGTTFYRQPPAVFKKEREDGTFEYELNYEADNFWNLPDPVKYYTNQLLIKSEESINTDLMNNYGETRKGKPVYKNFNDSKHTFSAKFTPRKTQPLVIGMDLGLTPAMAFTQIDEHGRVWVFEEIYTEDCTITDFIENKFLPLMRTKYPEWIHNYIVYVDPAARMRSPIDGKPALIVIRELGVNIKLARTNKPVVRLDAVDTYLRKVDGFHISDECKWLRKGFISGYRYRYLSRIEDTYRDDAPEKNEYSHVHDALQYAMLQHKHALQRTHPARKAFTYQPISKIGGY